MLDRQKLRTFLLGGLAGAMAGMLLAPRSGKELRSTIASRAEEARERSRETYFETQERVQERIERAREDGAPFSADVRTVNGEVSQSSSRRAGVSTDLPEAEETPKDARTEELLRKIEETRARLREQRDLPTSRTEDVKE